MTLIDKITRYFIHRQPNIPTVYNLIATQRSGSHAISSWLLHQHEHVHHDYHFKRSDGETFYFPSTFLNMWLYNHKFDQTHHNVSHQSTHRAVVCRESGDLKNVVDECVQMEKEAYFYKVRNILSLRDIYNTLASFYIKYETIHPHVLIEWRQRAKLILGLEPEFYEQLNRPYFINYNKWFRNIAYRFKICLDLGLEWTDRGLNVVPHFSGGSSHDGIGYDTRAQEMAVLERWKYVLARYPLFAVPLRNNQDLLVMSDLIFGPIEGAEYFRNNSYEETKFILEEEIRNN